ncbi:MAG: molybdate ABC transporter substrate-binding protein [Kangiellaceae bacterium]|nr:molybdate ABC transporter substrate-binding protein [Kangiellaceae bacterium]
MSKLLLGVLLIISYTAISEDINVAVSANFLKPIKAISQQFENQTNHKIILHLGSTGQLYAQAIHGAPFDLFLAADQERIDKLVEQNLTSHSSTYSCGLLAFYSESVKVNSIGDLNRLSKVALANPLLAPYGVAAEEVLSKTSLQAKKVYGQNIAATYQYAINRVVDGGFVAYSYVYQKPAEQVWLVPKSLYPSIKQNMALLKRSRNEAAKEFYKFLLSSEVQSSIAKMGYTSANDCK